MTTNFQPDVNYAAIMAARKAAIDAYQLALVNYDESPTEQEAIDLILIGSDVTAESAPGAAAATGSAADPILLADVKWMWFVSNSTTGNNGPDFTTPTATTIQSYANEALSSFLLTHYQVPTDCKIAGSYDNRVTGLQVGDRILFCSFWDGSYMGIYTITALGSGASKWVLTKTTDLDEASEFAKFYRVGLADTSIYAFTTAYVSYGGDGGDFGNENLQSWVLSGAGSLAAGYGAMAMNDSVAIGYEAIASYRWSMAIGNGAESTGGSASAFGQNAFASHNGSTCLGYGSRSFADSKTTVGGEFGGTAILQLVDQTRTGSFTIAKEDIGNFIEVNSAGAVTVSLPLDVGFVVFPQGTRFDICQAGAGQVTVAMAGGVNTPIKAYAGRKTAGQNAVITVVRTGDYQGDAWRVFGQTAV